MIHPAVQFFFEKAFPLTERNRLKSFIISLFKKEETAFKQLNYIFCSDKSLLEINQKFLEHDFLTDVISFPLSAPGEPVEAEIYISVDRVRDNARTLGNSAKSELHRVIFHGALHLCGYKDKTKSQVREMRAREDYYLELYGM